MAMGQTEQLEYEEHGIVVLGENKYQVPSSSNPDVSYVVEFVGRTEDGFGLLWECDCPARKTCKHIKLVSEISAKITDELGME